jgi:hypothetical protein
MSQPTQIPQPQSSEPTASTTVVIVVNGKDVTVPRKVTGAQIKSAARVPADFDLFRVHGRKEIPVANEEQLTVTKGEKFVASPTLDPSYAEHPMQESALASVRDTFPDHVADIENDDEGAVLITVRDVAIGEGWNQPVIDLAVKLQVTFPSTPPYPFYGPPGMVRVDGLALGQLQPHVVLDGRERTQISLTKPFDPAAETLGSRFAAVVRWLRSPR